MINKTPTKIIILAAGKGTRMKSDLAKVLHQLKHKPMINYVLDAVQKIQPEATYLVIGHQADQVKRETSAYPVTYVEQKEQLGTGHAVMMVEPHLADQEGITIILCGDVPLLRAETIQHLKDLHLKNKSAATIITTKLAEPGHYGRIIRNGTGLVTKIVEFRDATPEERACQEINSGIYAIDTRELFSALKKITTNNDQKEYYLTDVIEIINKRHKPVQAYCIENYQEIQGINTIEDLKNIEKSL